MLKRKNIISNYQNISEDSMYTLQSRLRLTVLALLIGILVAGFWNYQIVDNFGSKTIAGNLVGDTNSLSLSFKENGLGFGFLFGIAAGLASTFTACNCVMFAMLPGLTCASDRSTSRRTALKSLGIFSLLVIVVTGIYGLYIGSLQINEVQAYNQRDFRLSHASGIFTFLGILMLVWGFISFGYLNFIISRVPIRIRSFFANPYTKAGIMGLMVGCFAVGRPFGVFRDFITYI